MKEDTEGEEKIFLVRNTLREAIESVMKEINELKNSLLEAEKREGENVLSNTDFIAQADKANKLMVMANYLSGVNDGIVLMDKSEEELNKFLETTKAFIKKAPEEPKVPSYVR